MVSLTMSEVSDRFRSAPDRLLDVGAGEVAYRRFGTGPDVLFVHGWPVSGATFRTLVPALSDHVTCHVIDLPGAGASRFDRSTPITIAQHTSTVLKVVDLLGFDDVAVVAHDSGGLIARHALAGDRRVRSFGLIDTEPLTVGWRFKSFISLKGAPKLAQTLGWVCGNRLVRRNELVFGGAFADTKLLDGEFEEFFLRPIHRSEEHRDAAARLLRTFDMKLVAALADVHRRIAVPVQLVWGEKDPFFPAASAEAMVSSFPNAKLHVVKGARLFCHEERPEEVAEALLPTLLGSR